MDYELLIGDRAYSSWSLRGALLLDGFGVPHRTTLVPMYSEAFTQMQADHAPARTVPQLAIGEGAGMFRVWDSLAMAETLAERHPDKPYWPADPAARGAARSLATEMHASFRALRDRPSMNLRRRYDGFVPTDAEAADAERVQMLWNWALDRFGGPYLGGEHFGAVDAMYAPVTTRFVTYGFAMDSASEAYVRTMYAHDSFRRWHAMADASPRILERYDLDLPARPGTGAPRPDPLPTEPWQGDITQAINSVCPYSGNPIEADSLAKIDGHIVGFCNQFCRNKSVADAAAWPALMAVLREKS